MKTLKEIKKGLECCYSDDVEKRACKECPYEYCEECEEVLGRDAIAMIQQLEAQVPKWISVEERLPGEVEYVLCIVRYGEDAFDYELGFFLRNKWHTAGRSDGAVSHWMPLPEPPKEEEK